MKNGKLLTALFILSVLLFGCDNNNLTPDEKNIEDPKQFYFDSLSVEELTQLIVGEWEWIYSKIGRPFAIYNPDSVGYTQQRIFNSDSTVNYYKNNQPQSSYTYIIYKFKILPNDSLYHTAIYISGGQSQLYFSHPDSMMIGTGWVDGVDEYFVRKK